LYSLKSVKLKSCDDIAYIDEGKGSVLLFVHGLASYSQCWQQNISYLKDHFRCIAIDLPGNGLSTYGNYSYSVSFFVQCVKEFIDALKLKQVILVGHSLGGQIAIKYTATYPQSIDKLVLCAPAGFETFNGFERNMYQSSFHFFNFFSTDSNSLEKSITTSFYHYTAQADDLIKNLQKILKRYPAQGFRNMIEKCIEGMLNEPVFNLLPEIEQQTLVIFGERDTFIPNRLIHPYNTKHIAQEGVKNMPHAQLEMLPQCGHYVQWEKYREVNDLIKAFVEE
jgi:pimeloyl-ACP methyl ester carboxylesterase